MQQEKNSKVFALHAEKRSHAALCTQPEQGWGWRFLMRIMFFLVLVNKTPNGLAQYGIDLGAVEEALAPSGTRLSDQPFPLRTHQPIYQNPFDLSAGGASLTKASQEGSFFVNPSLPAFGRSLPRWTFARTQVHLGEATLQTAYKAYSGLAANAPVSFDLVKEALKAPNHVGHDTALGYINKYVSLVGFSNVRTDLALRKFGDAGVPQLRARAYGVGGGGLGLSYPFGDFLAIGASAKYLEVAQATEDLSIGDASDTAALADRVKALLKRGTGIAGDAGMTIQLRSRHLDFRLAGVVADISSTSLGADIDPFLETLSVGAGLTLHTRDHSIHCAADLRDALGAYKEHWTYRSYAGCKMLYYKHFGIAGGLSQGYGTAGVVLEIFFTRIEAGTYTREVGKQSGVEGRKVYFFAVGAEI